MGYNRNEQSTLECLREAIDSGMTIARLHQLVDDLAVEVADALIEDDEDETKEVDTDYDDHDVEFGND